MKKIGFVDYYISEWHANNYPKWIKEACEEMGLDYEVSYVWAMKDISDLDGVSTAEWCEKFGAVQCESAKELCDKVIKLRDGNSKLVRSIKKTKKTIKETEDALDINIAGMVKATASIAGNIVVGRGSAEGAKGVTKLVAKAVDAIKIGKTKVDEVSALIGTGEKQKN